MNERRRDAAAAVVNGKIFCCGGWNKRSLSSVECYDPPSNSWTLISPMKSPCFHFGAIEINGILLIVGKDSDDLNSSNPVWLLDFINNKWIEQPRPLQKRNYCTAVRLGEEVLICGGIYNDDNETDTVEIFDGIQWRNGPKLPKSALDSPIVAISIEFSEYLLSIST